MTAQTSAFETISKLKDKLTSASDRYSAWPFGADLMTIASAFDGILEQIAALPDDYRAPRRAKVVIPGHSYTVKASSPLAAGLTVTVKEVLDPHRALVELADKSTAVVATAHLK